ncbi:hypothetical protein VaNZ11_013479 [Volvox africanus]|uniref:Protein kinase domain-containing protein n=1 Tax=Volvox africanus TaxID=51714 RepID=A0ABQ5SHK8_9CHLO|nr:hypothetical protein VaNZ11_013479 [Volvox africanus]
MMKSALKRLFVKEQVEVVEVQKPSSELSRPPASSSSPECLSNSLSTQLYIHPQGAEDELSDVIVKKEDINVAPSKRSAFSYLSEKLARSSWAGMVHKSPARATLEYQAQPSVAPLSAERTNAWKSPTKRAYSRSMDITVLNHHPVAPIGPQEKLPCVDHLGDSEWTRALTGNIKSVAQVHGAMGYPGVSMPNSPCASQIGRGSTGHFVRHRQSSPMWYVGGAGSGVDVALLLQANQSMPIPVPNQPGAHTPLMDDVDDALESEMRYLDGDGDNYGDDGVHCFTSTLPSVVPPALLEAAAEAGVSLEVDLDTEVELSNDPPLGHGSAGTVFKAVYNGKSCAVKMLSQDVLFGAGCAELHSFVQEAVVMAPLRHPNIVTFLGGSLQPPHVFLLAELCDTSLDAWIHRGVEPRAFAPEGPRRTGPWSESGRCGGQLNTRQMLKVALDVAMGLQYLHGRTPAIVHRDLKPANILIDSNGMAKISDFGLARLKTSNAIHTRAPEVGSVGYMAPECFTSEHGLLTDKCDTWSLGTILWEMVSRKRPFSGLTLTEYYREVVLRKSRLQIPQDDGVCPMALRRLISSCWYDNPEERPSCAHIVAELTRMLKYCPRDIV